MRKKYQRKNPLRSAAAKFWQLVKPTDGCWLWIGALTTSGYPVWCAGIGHPQVLSARFSFELKNGRPPVRSLIRKCRNKLCVNPDHLSDVTPVKEKPVRKPWPDRFSEQIQAPNENGCWIFGNGPLNQYGRFSVNGIVMGAHRLSWEMYNSPLPDGAWVLHHCDTPACVNPAHLYVGTPQDNVNDRVRRERSGNALPLSEEERRVIRESTESTSRIAITLGRPWATVDRFRKNPDKKRSTKGNSETCYKGHPKIGSPKNRWCKVCNQESIRKYQAKKAQERTTHAN